MEEVWKDAVGYEGLYQVSNLGRVKTLGQHKTFKREKIMTPQKVGGGYLSVRMAKENVVKNEHIHRLVAKTFLDNPENKPMVHHIDGNVKNNIVSNLMWVSESEHSLIDKRGNRLNEERAVCQYTKSGEFVARYDSTCEAQRATGIWQQNISKCCLGRKGFYTAGGYVWKFEL